MQPTASPEIDNSGKQRRDLQAQSGLFADETDSFNPKFQGKVSQVETFQHSVEPESQKQHHQMKTTSENLNEGDSDEVNLINLNIPASNDKGKSLNAEENMKNEIPMLDLHQQIQMQHRNDRMHMKLLKAREDKFKIVMDKYLGDAADSEIVE